MNLGLEWLLSRPTLETSSDPLKVDMERYELEQTELDFCPPFYPNLAARMSLLGAPVILALLVIIWKAIHIQSVHANTDRIIDEVVAVTAEPGQQQRPLAG